MKVLPAKRLLVMAALIVGLAGSAFAQTRVHLTADAVSSFQNRPSATQVIESFTTANQPLFWGFGYEVVHRHFGIGGVYSADFTRTTASVWWLDWYGEALYLSYHLFARRTLIDPFVSIGIGSAGRVYLDSNPASTPAGSTLLLSIFPVLSGGLGVDLDGLYLSAKLSYLPVISPPPATSFNNVPLGRFQVVAAAGFALGR